MKIFDIIQNLGRVNRFSKRYEGKRFKTKITTTTEDNNIITPSIKPNKPRSKWIKFKTKEGKTITMEKDFPITLKEAREVMENPFLTEDEKLHKLKSEGASDSLIASANLFSRGRYRRY